MTARSVRDQFVTGLIAFVSSFFGVALVMGSTLVRDLVVGDDPEAAGTLAVAVMSVAWVFIGIGAYTAAVVTSNTFNTIVAGRVREIAQYRLLGATASSLRRKLAVEGLVAGVVGSLAGLLAALSTYRLVVQTNVAAGDLPDLQYSWFEPATVAPAIVAIVTVWLAAYVGSRAVARVSPVQALSADVETPAEQLRMGIGRTVVMWLLLGSGLALLLGGVALGLVSPLGVLVAFLGGVLSFTGVIVGSVAIIPRLMALVGRAFGRSAAAQLASGNAVRSPRSASRSSIGMVIGVALTVMFVVALATMSSIILADIAKEVDAAVAAEELEMFMTVIRIVTTIMVALTAVSAVLAAIGMVSNLSLSVLQRRRELGLLRAVGATGAQVRAMIVTESALASIVAVGFGAILGVFYGWAGAQATFGAVSRGLVAPAVPWQLVIAIVGATVLLGALAAVGPAIRATRIAPIEALRVT
ncbi:FtsX-like permease family protein [Pseudoclavibacter chungangensis]|uniref:FtsX-like permease family protein n=1 Tax=Pseudoclavibacter chungangensis TaxID=587635 RepID=A0A7J5BS77_9MICO|nr:FtsX-like permease family protein [Pseudoclavibacter chungangensis]KAB1656839.1 FtsX-like permease family protein [Pseudoclavibacter chungangensis]NYJ67299.1 putative ABC transport system permease protein [Pseudoclavibacter chungangensis]